MNLTTWIHALQLIHESRVQVAIPNLGRIEPSGIVHGDRMARGWWDGIARQSSDFWSHVYLFVLFMNGMLLWPWC